VKNTGIGKLAIASQTIVSAEFLRIRSPSVCLHTLYARSRLRYFNCGHAAAIKYAVLSVICMQTRILSSVASGKQQLAEACQRLHLICSSKVDSDDRLVRWLCYGRGIIESGGGCSGYCSRKQVG